MRSIYLLISTLALAQQIADPITDKLRFEIASAQRDYLLAQQQLEQATTILKSKIESAQKICAPKIFNAQSMQCIEDKK